MTFMEDFLCSKQNEHVGEQLNIGCLCYLSKDVTKADLKARLLATLMKFERLRSRIVKDSRGRFYFEDHGDAEQVIDSMIIEKQLQSGEESDFLQSFRDNVTLAPWSPDKPHWDVHIIRGIPKSAETKNCSVALFFRIDHVLGDGQALLHALLSICEAESNQMLRFPERANKNANASAVSKISNAFVAFIVGLFYHIAMFFPALFYSVSSRVLADTPSAVKLKSALPELVTKKNVGLTPTGDLEVVKRLGKAHGCTVNDLMITWVAGAVRRYLLKLEDPCVNEDKEVRCRSRAVFAYSRRIEGQDKPIDFANRLVFLPVPLPVALPGLAERIERVRSATAFVKSTLVAFFTHSLMSLLYGIPAVGRKVLGDEVKEGLLRITSCFSSLAGPIQKVSICGATVEYMAVSANPAGVAMSFTAFTYAGMVTMSATTHPKLVNGPEMVRCLNQEWESWVEAAGK